MSIYTSYHSYSSSNNFSNSMTSSHTSYSGGGSGGSNMSASGWSLMDEERIRADDMREETFFAVGAPPVPLMVDQVNPPPLMVNPEDVHLEFIPPSISIPPVRR